MHHLSPPANLSIHLALSARGTRDAPCVYPDLATAASRVEPERSEARIERGGEPTIRRYPSRPRLS